MISIAWTCLALWHGSRGDTLAGSALALSEYAVTATTLYDLIIESVPEQRMGEATGLTYVLFTAFFGVGFLLATRLPGRERWG